MNEVMKIGRFTVTGRVAEGVTQEEKEERLRMFKKAILDQIEKDRKKRGELNET